MTKQEIQELKEVKAKISSLLSQVDATCNDQAKLILTDVDLFTLSRLYALLLDMSLELKDVDDKRRVKLVAEWLEKKIKTTLKEIEH